MRTIADDFSLDRNTSLKRRLLLPGLSLWRQRISSPRWHSTEKLQRRLVPLCALSIFCLVICAPVNYTYSDPHGCLLVSQAIVKHGTVKLDGYTDHLRSYSKHLLHEKNGHTYYYFPLGTSLFAVPYVATMSVFGQDMVEHDQSAQRLLTAGVAAIIFVLLFLIARVRLSFWASILLAGAFWLGTSYSSTMGTALWSHSLAAVFSLLAILLCLRAKAHRTPTSALLLSAALFSAYLCRPTLAVLSPVLLLFVFCFDRRAAVRTSLGLAPMLVVFLG